MSSVAVSPKVRSFMTPARLAVLNVSAGWVSRPGWSPALAPPLPLSLLLHRRRPRGTLRPGQTLRLPRGRGVL